MKNKIIKKTKNTILDEKNIFNVLKQMNTLFKKQKLETTLCRLEVCGKCLKEGKITLYCSKHINRDENKTN